MKKERSIGAVLARVGRTAVANVVALLLMAIAVAVGVSNHEEPAARYVVIECEGFDVLASTGSQRVSCESATDEAPATADDERSTVLPVRDRDGSVVLAHRKA